MMTDPKVLADALVEAGIGSPYGLKLSNWYSLPGDSFGASGVVAEKFITDWRVAGKVLDRCSKFKVVENRTQDMKPEVWVRTWHGEEGNGTDYNLPRAIIEAWYQPQSRERVNE